MDLEQFTTLIHEHGLSEYQDDILASVRPAILLKLGQAEPGHKIHGEDLKQLDFSTVYVNLESS